MDTFAFELYFNLITLACGIYALYTAIKLRKLGKLFPNQLLVPKDAKPSDCLDEEEYLAYVFPRLLFLALLLIVIAVFCLADAKWHICAMLAPNVEDLSFYVTEGSILLCLVALVWYMVCWTKARKMYWV